MKKRPKENKDKHDEAFKQEEDKGSHSLHSDVERKHEELKNSTIGGF